ncbi:MAG: 4a-hydroxytetrahydrobiopterin dehydratase [Actinomycetota bacterium]|jgi:4a-hydroxytetrahydrobiopterin dehydratase|nr:4a-hydroxytetrahydrobiopterin dehydratase [Actinomycetota bacterium]
MSTLTDDEITEGLSTLAGWERAGDEIVKEYRLGNFKDAVAFVVRLSYEAEAANHHPDLDIRWNKVRVALSTHSEGGLTAKDLDLAAAVEALAPAG